MKPQQKLQVCRFLLVTLLTLFVLTSHAEPLPYQSNPLLATVEGQAITLDDVKTKAIHDLTLQLYQQLQQRLLKIQEELETTTVEATVGGGVVIATATGKQRITSIKIDPEAVVSDDVSMLEDLILAAVNEVMNKAAELANQKMSAVTGGMKIPGVM